MSLRIENGVAHLSGRLDLATAKARLAEGEQAIVAGCVVFDLSAVEQVDSAALSLLLAWRRRAVVAGRAWSVRGLPDSVRGLMALYGVEDVLAE